MNRAPPQDREQPNRNELIGRSDRNDHPYEPPIVLIPHRHLLREEYLCPKELKIPDQLTKDLVSDPSADYVIQRIEVN